jgi:hypothetical protein
MTNDPADPARGRAWDHHATNDTTATTEAARDFLLVFKRQ